MLLVGATGVPLDMAPVGNPCSLRTDPIVIAPGTGSAGSYSWSSQLKVSAANGVAVYLQAGAPDPAANRLGLVLSNGVAAIWPDRNRPAVRIWTRGDDTSTSGALQLLYGLVIKIGIY